MEQHVKLVGIFHVVLSSLGLFAALIVFAVFGGLAAFVGTSGDANASTAVPVLGGIGGIIAICIAAISLPGLIGGIGLLKFAPWSRILVLIISVLELIHVPLGTALGIYGIWTLTKPEVAAMFERRRYQPA